MKAGLNLFSLRNFVSAGEEVFTETLIKLKNMGYDYMQYSGGPIDADMLARVSKNSGLPFVLTHAPMSDIIGDTENLMEKHAPSVHIPLCQAYRAAGSVCRSFPYPLRLQRKRAHAARRQHGRQFPAAQLCLQRLRLHAICLVKRIVRMRVPREHTR